MSSLAGRTAIITGSSSGIGQGIAIRLAREGANVVIDYVGAPEGAEETRQKAEATGAKAIVVQADVAKVEAVRMLVDEAWKAFGSADILVNNAGMEKKSDFWETCEDDYDHVLGVNLKGPFFLTQAFVQRLRAAKKPGRVINISSVHEDMAFPGFATYCASKGGVRMLMRDLAVELGPLGITVNNVAPGAIATPINTSLLEDKPKLNALLANIPLGRLGSVDDVAGLVAWLASDEAAYVNGSTFIIDGGLSRNYHEQ
ncbi:glucose 1-dehydrogenase [Silvibacterium dinghuense]|uniref:Glucose 1-dehydrogenase n=1 Tax=Silvibacterium dinghuense TaxID=1560006 RepID=A0A4V1NVV0_9BACT|nr:glucose 1-dehydrogenase [Silvibacterium dinghuense]RXS97192.1 glucose 1-dehydrogenase [Silvibacterium dinghuense]GGG96965.1 glucose-1-dehydrogenase [Silvibacterium dinghuense]